MTLPTHLQAAMRYRSTFGDSNTCVQRATALMLDLPGATLVFGVLRAATAEEIERDPRASPVPFIHAWVEHRGVLFAPTTIERTGGELRSFPVDLYYEKNGITRTWRLGPAGFMAIARRYRLSAAFKHGSARAGSGEVADALLRAAGVRYKLSDRNTLLPAD